MLKTFNEANRYFEIDKLSEYDDKKLNISPFIGKIFLI